MGGHGRCGMVKAERRGARQHALAQLFHSQDCTSHHFSPPVHGFGGLTIHPDKAAPAEDNYGAKNQKVIPRSRSRSRKSASPSPIRLAIEPRGMPMVCAACAWVWPAK